MKAKEYQLLQECIERGIGNGYVKAHKHTDKPAPENIWDTQVQYVMDEIEQRKKDALDAGHTSPWCASCHNMGNPNAKVCRDCQTATPMFTAAVRDFLTEVEGTRQ